MKTKHTALAALLAASAGLANAGTDLSLARSYAIANDASSYNNLLSNYNASDVKVKAQIQARYQYNKRDMNTSPTPFNSDNNTTIGFSIRRAKIEVSGNVTDNIKGKVKFAFDRNGGAAELEDAYASWQVNDGLSLKIGQFKQQLIHEENVSSSKQLAAERSAMNETYNQGFSQGIEAQFGGDSWRGFIGFTDGLKTANTPFNSSSEADYALNARFEFLLGDAEWSQFKQFTSWRGSNAGGMIGAAIAYQSMGSTNPALANDATMTTGTIDFSWVADGWNFYAAGVWRNMDPGGAANSMDDFGLLAQGGMFVTDQDELFGRWDAVYPDSNNAPRDKDFNAMTLGWNHYFTPESHAAKFTLDFNYYFDAPDSSIVSTSNTGGHNLLPDAGDGQWGITAQMQVLF